MKPLSINYGKGLFPRRIRESNALAPAVAGSSARGEAHAPAGRPNVTPGRLKTDQPEADACGRVIRKRQETAMIRRVAGLGVLLAFYLWGAASVQAQTASDYAQGVTVSGASATIFFNPTSTTTTWTDVHYAVNGGALQNLRMARDASTGHETQPVL